MYTASTAAPLLWNAKYQSFGLSTRRTIQYIKSGELVATRHGHAYVISQKAVDRFNRKSAKRPGPGRPKPKTTAARLKSLKTKDISVKKAKR